MSTDTEDSITERQVQHWQHLLRATEAVDALVQQHLHKARNAALARLAEPRNWQPRFPGLAVSGMLACALIVAAIVLLWQTPKTPPHPSLESLQWASEDNHAHDLYRNLKIYEWMDRVERDQGQAQQDGLSNRSAPGASA